MKRPVAERDAVRFQVIARAQGLTNLRPAIKKGSSAGGQQSRDFSQPKLSIGLDLGDRRGWYCAVTDRVE